MSWVAVIPSAVRDSGRTAQTAATQGRPVSFTPQCGDIEPKQRFSDSELQLDVFAVFACE